MEIPLIELSKDVENCHYVSFARGSESPKGPVDIFFGGLEHCLPHYEIHRSGFPVFLLEYLLEGEAELELAGEAHELRAGSLFWYGPGIPCHFVNKGERPLIKYFFAFHCSEGTPGTLYGLSRRVVGANRGGERLRDLVRMLFEEASAAHAESWRISCAYLDILFLHCRQSEALERHTGERAFKVFREVKETIATNFLELRTMEDISSATGFAPSYISRLFKRYHHLTAYSYLQQLKMDYAFDLLRQGRRSVQHTAALTGFDDPFHFSRLFKKFKGIPPSQVR
jgi:AraC-like DNA-binding protein